MSTAVHTTVLPPSFTAATVCEAFQITAAERPDSAAASKSAGPSMRTGCGGLRVGWQRSASARVTPSRR